MPGGHTNRATINKRRPMSPGMKALLSHIVKGGRVSGHRFDTAEQNQARALMDRGYAIPDPAGWWAPTEEGIAANG